MSDDTITLHDTRSDELSAIHEMEQGPARPFIVPYMLERHQHECSRPVVIYKSIRQGGELVGFVILVLNPDGVSGASADRRVRSGPWGRHGRRRACP
jgi:hypothetical protein